MFTLATSTIMFQGCAKAPKTQKDTVNGSATGGTKGAYIGRKMGRQADKIKNSIPNTEVIREGKGIVFII